MSESQDVNVATDYSDARLALIWLQGQDLTEVTPATAKRMFWNAWYEMMKTETPKPNSL